MNGTRVYFDLETGGRELERPITQIAAIARRGKTELARFEKKLKFDPAHCDPEALRIQGYTEERWADAVDPLVACMAFAAWLKPFACVRKVSNRTGKTYFVAQLAGYNAAVFDAPRLQNLFQKLGVFLPADYKVLDVFQLALWFFQENQDPESHKLKPVCEFFGIPLEMAHDALADVVATAELGEFLLERLRLEAFASGHSTIESAIG